MKNILKLITAAFLISAGMLTSTNVSAQRNLDSFTIAHYTFDNENGNDTSSNHLNATKTGTISYPKGIKGKCAEFGSLKNYFKVKDDSKLHYSGGSTKGWSISVWYKQKASTFTTGVMPIVCKMDDAGTSGNADYYIFTELGKLYWGIGSSTDTNSWQRIKMPALNVWHHLVVTSEKVISGGKTSYREKMYLDGVLKANGVGYTKSSNTNSLYIGYSWDGNGKNNFKGSIDEVRIFGTSLTSAEVDSLHKDTVNKVVIVPTPRTTSSLRGHVINSSNNALSYSMVYLAKINWADSTVNFPYSFKTDSTGRYEFSKVVNDSTFYLFANPDTTIHKDELPTLYNKTLTISSAMEISLHNQDSVIDFQTLNMYDPAGNYNVFGNVFYCQACKKGGSGKPIKDLNLVVSDEFGRKVAYLKTDVNGKFNISNLKNGTYYIFVNRPGADNSKAPSIVVKDGNITTLSMSFNGSQLKIDQITGIDENGNSINDQSILVKNISGNSIEVLNNSETRFNFNIIDLNGKLVNSFMVLPSGNQVMDLKSGIYILQGVSINGSSFNQKLFVK